MKVNKSAIGPNVGSALAAALAAAGIVACDPARRVACETDYLAISGATFPRDIPRAELVAFNRATLHSNMTEADEWSRYCRIANFFHRKGTR